jgi:hypothetical protein
MVNITNEDLQNQGYSITTSTSNLIANKTQDLFCKDLKDRIVDLSDSPRPEYYGGKNNTYEVFNVLEAWELDKDFYLGNVIKYVARAGKKNKSTEKEDLQKALVYLQRRIDSL